ncbi:MAG: class IV adenylate cyclase [Phycisphaeraceae bacterium]
MPVEIEAKMRLHDIAALETKLAAAGGVRGLELVEINTFFDTPRGDLKAGDQGLRVRLERSTDGEYEKATITHKGPRAHGRLKMRSETEIEVSDAKAAAELLAALGYASVLSFEKRRVKWSMDGCSIEIDTLPYLGHFVEIEGPSEAIVLSVRKNLGLEGQPMISASYISLLVTYLTEHNIITEHVGFESSEQPA